MKILLYIFLSFIIFSFEYNSIISNAKDIEYEVLSKYLNERHNKDDCISICKISSDYSFAIENKDFLIELIDFLSNVDNNSRMEILKEIINNSHKKVEYASKFKLDCKFYMIVDDNISLKTRPNSNLYICPLYIFCPVIFNKAKNIAFFGVIIKIGRLAHYEGMYVLMKLDGNKWKIIKSEIIWS